MRIDTSNIVLFGHSMGAWVCLKVLAQLPGIIKGFALSTWDIYADFKDVKTEKQLTGLLNDHKADLSYFVLNTPLQQMYEPVITNRTYYNIENDTAALSNKQIIMIDEHNRNKALAASLKNDNHNYFDYEVWQTDHPFTNKRVALINKVLKFLDAK